MEFKTALKPHGIEMKTDIAWSSYIQPPEAQACENVETRGL